MAKKLSIIQETQARLIREYLLDPKVVRKIESANEKDRLERIARIQTENPKMDMMSALFVSMYRQMNEQKLTSKINIRCANKMLEILFSWLSEEGQRNAREEMRALSVDEVLGDHE
jgi:hypothetical protein